MNSIVLIGFMGSGKSTVARLLAARAGLGVIELDDLILEASGEESIAAIFDRRGEPEFRRLEKEAALEAAKRDRVVISAGGGLVSQTEVMEALKAAGSIVVFLDTSFEELGQRLEHDKDRPLFRDRRAAEELYRKRLPLYRRFASHTLVTDGKRPPDIAEEIWQEVLSKWL